MSRLFWIELAVIVLGVLVILLFVRVARIERILSGWTRRRGM